MKRIFTGIVLIAMMILGACGGKKADDPITKIELGMTLEQAMEAEPELTVYEGKGYSCSKSYADAEGTMLISLSPFDGDNSVFTVLWQLDPTDGNGKSVYDIPTIIPKLLYIKLSGFSMIPRPINPVLIIPLLRSNIIHP